MYVNYSITLSDKSNAVFLNRPIGLMPTCDSDHVSGEWATFELKIGSHMYIHLELFLEVISDVLGYRVCCRLLIYC